MNLSFILDFDYINYSYFLLSSVGIYYLYKIFHIQLSISNKYKQLDTYKKKYVIKNFIKTAIMIFIVYKLLTEEYINIINGTLDANILKFYGGLYVSNDLMGIIMVKNLPSNTKYHHITSTSLYTIFCFIKNINDNVIAKCMIYYTIFSCLAFTVNLYLGLRFFQDINTKSISLVNHNKNNNIIVNNNHNDNIINYIRFFAYYNYIFALGINIILQIYLLMNEGFLSGDAENIFGSTLYSLMLVPIIRDDFILLEWLREKQITY